MKHQQLLKIPHNYLFLFLALFLATNSHLFGGERYVIKGEIKASETSQNLAIPVALIEIRMGEEPVIKPIQKSVADEKGGFSFTLKENPEGVFYRVSTVIRGQVVGSNPVKFDGNSNIINLVLKLPKITEESGKLNFTKNILVFDLMENYIQITDIINLENSTTSTIDATKKAFTRKLPKYATKVTIIDPPPGTKIENIEGEVHYRLIFPPGRHQLYMTYRLPLAGDNLEILNYPPPAVGQMELIVPVNSIQADFEQVDTPVSTIERSWNNQVFKVKYIDIKDGTTSVNITISDIPLAQKKLFYPAIILLILLLSGLFWYLKSGLHGERS
jgi:hypothetical protein